MSTRSKILRALLTAFPTANPPGQDRIAAGFVGEIESQALSAGLAGRRWNEVDSDFIETHGDWLVYLSAPAFAYYLPPWMAFSLDYERAGYVADWTVSFFCHPPASEPISEVQARMLDALDSAQKSAVIQWIGHMIETNPESDPGHLKKQGLSLEDAVYNLGLRAFDSSWN